MKNTNSVETEKLINALEHLSKFQANNQYDEEYRNHKTALLSLILYQRKEVENLIQTGFLHPNQGAMLIDSLNGLLAYARVFVDLINDKDLFNIAEVIEQTKNILPKAPF